jgi:HD-GYP domain-containing protein (c-di-GMP phosphodiesterase class II)
VSAGLRLVGAAAAVADEVGMPAADSDRLLRALAGPASGDGPGWVLLAVELAPAPWAALGALAAVDAWAALLPRLSPYGEAPHRAGERRFAFLVPPPADALDRRPDDLRAAVVHSLIGHGLRGVHAEVRLGPGGEARTALGALELVDRKLASRWERHELSARRQVRDVLFALLDERRRREPGAMRQVAVFAIAVARRLRVPEDALEDIVRAAELQDIGKATLPESILGKDGPLTDAEWAVVRRHPVIAERIVGAAPALAEAARLIRASQERFDGAGYPDGLAGEEIPLGARILAVCVAFAAMLSPRAYRPPLSWAHAAAELRAARGAQLDPDVVDAFLAEVVGDAQAAATARSIAASSSASSNGLAMQTADPVVTVTSPVWPDMNTVGSPGRSSRS